MGLDYSIVIPVYNEEESLEPLLTEIHQAMDPLEKPYEVIFVNDYSSDGTTDILEDFQKTYGDRVRVRTLLRRSGQTEALRKGMAVAGGEIVITLDADLQNDPADIPRLLRKMEEGFDCVCGWRKARQDTWLKARLSKLGNILQRLLTRLTIHDVSCTLRAYKRSCVPRIPLNWEGQHRFIPLCLALQGFRVGEIVSNHRQRRFGRTKYSHKRIFRVIVDFFRVLFTGGRR